MDYEILVFEHNSMYDWRDANRENVLNVFLETCREYVNPEYVEEKSEEKAKEILADKAEDDGDDGPDGPIEVNLIK